MKFVSELPPDARGRNAGATSQIVASLKARPGQWAVVYEATPSTNNATRLKKQGCEAVTRNRRVVNGQQVCDIYARWPAAGA